MDEKPTSCACERCGAMTTKELISIDFSANVGKNPMKIMLEVCDACYLDIYSVMLFPLKKTPAVRISPWNNLAPIKTAPQMPQIGGHGVLGAKWANYGTAPIPANPEYPTPNRLSFWQPIVDDSGEQAVIKYIGGVICIAKPGANSMCVGMRAIDSLQLSSDYRTELSCYAGGYPKVSLNKANYLVRDTFAAKEAPPNDK